MVLFRERGDIRDMVQVPVRHEDPLDRKPGPSTLYEGASEQLLSSEKSRIDQIQPVAIAQHMEVQPRDSYLKDVFHSKNAPPNPSAVIDRRYRNRSLSQPSVIIGEAEKALRISATARCLGNAPAALRWCRATVRERSLSGFVWACLSDS